MYSELHQLFNKVTEIPADDWEYFALGLQHKRYAKGAYFLKQGKVSGQIAFVTKGVFRLYTATEKKELNYNFFAEGQFAVDYESFLKGRAGTFSIQALEDCEVYVFSKVHLLEQYSSSHAWERFGRLAGEQAFLKSRERLKELLYLSAEERYLQFMKQYKNLYNRLPLYHIASYLGLDVTSLSRIRRGIGKK